MIDLEKVIKGIDICLQRFHCGKDCPYYDDSKIGCEEQLREDAINLLKEQEELLHKKQKDIDRLCNEISEWKHKFHDISLKEQEANNDEWITIWREDDPDTSTHARCSICNRISERPLGRYCKWCGAKMNQEWGIDG